MRDVVLLARKGRWLVTLHLYEGGGHTLQGAYERLYFERTLEFFQKRLGP